ncbi:MAG: cation:proton antiporter [Acidobacteria bacterium]|nr:cation:proton antiporter [Acidobacteriota bacterium]
MTVAVAFAFIGGVILVGFLAHLLFRVTKIPSVLLLIGIGIVLGPVTGWVTSGSLVAIAPFFGTLALLIILFEGGLGLDVSSVRTQAPKASILSLLGFLISFLAVGALAFFGLGMPVIHSLLLASLLGAASPAIVIPLVSGLSVRQEVRTLLKLESALGDVLLIVAVLFLLDAHATGKQSVPGIALALFLSIAVAFVISSVAGALWARLIGWMGKEPLAYMLTLGFVFLLYFGVEELGGSAAFAVLMFGMILENMHVVADRVGPQIRYFFGIDIRAEQFVLQAFMKNITEELSFLVRTFFFVYLGLLLDFGALTPAIALSGIAMAVLLFGGRYAAVRAVLRKGAYTAGERQVVLSMLPRGLATAVMAFLPVQLGIPGAELFPIYAFIVIVVSNIQMTGGVIFAERRLGRERAAEKPAAEEPARIPEGEREPTEAAGDGPAPRAAVTVLEETPYPGAGEGGAGRKPSSFTEQGMRLLGIRPEEREQQYLQAMQNASMAPSIFWVQILLASVLTALGLVLNQSSIIIGAALIVPIAWPVLAAGLALAAGDIYLLLRLLWKLLLVVLLVAALSALFSELLPFNAVTAEIASRTRPTILDFLVALFSGMAGAALTFGRKRLLRYFPGALLGLALMPPLAVLGFGLGREFSTEIFRGATLLFIANFFAAILGAALVYAAAGMPAAASLETVGARKRGEMNQPFVRFLFERLGLGTLIGRAGSTRARLMVIVVFLLALVIPLQMALDQLSREFRARQAVSVVEKMFDQPGRSAIINSMATIGEEEISVRVQVATNSLFTSEDIRRFEERVADRTGVAARLDLVQSLSDIGEGRKLMGMLAPPAPDSVPYSPGVPEMARDLRDAVAAELRAMALPGTIAVVRAAAELPLDGAPPSFRIEYLSESPLSGDARELLARLMEDRMGLRPERLEFHHVPSRFDFPQAGGGIRMDQAPGLREIQETLECYPQVRAHVEIPADLGPADGQKLERRLAEAASLLALPARASFTQNPELKGGVRITLRSR